MSLPDEDGVYLYSDIKWERIYVDGPYVPEVDGVYAIYFRNRLCPGCRAFDETWAGFVTRYRSSATYAIAQCKNFFIECSDIAALDSFVFYLVFVTPQVVVVVIDNGIPVYVEREAGSLDEETLRDLVVNVRKRMEKTLSGGSEEEEEGEGIYVDFSKKNWKEIVQQLKKLIIEGKTVREVCDIKGCRVVIE